MKNQSDEENMLYNFSHEQINSKQNSFVLTSELIQTPVVQTMQTPIV